MLVTSRYSDWFWLQDKSRKCPISLHLKIFCCLNFDLRGGEHVNPLGPDGILLFVINYVVIYFSGYDSKKCCRCYACYHGYQGYQRSLIAVVR